MEPLLYGVILRQTPLADDARGLNTSTCQAQVRLGDTETSAIIKRLPERSLAVECLCAQIGRALGLPIPRPMILIDRQRSLWFGAERLPHPDLRQLGAMSALARQLSAWAHLADACAFDGWIANDDRNQGNLLTDGRGRFWLIDHERALAPDQAPTAPCFNALLAFAVSASAHTNLTESLSKACARCLELDICAEHSAGLPDMLQFLQTRAPSLWPLMRTEVTGNDEFIGF